MDIHSSGSNAAIIEDALRNYTKAIDRLYWQEINAPMESLVESSKIIGYSFTTKEYPPSEELIETIETELNEIIANSSYINDICIYTSTLDDFIAAHAPNNASLSDDKYKELIYAYNSNLIAHYPIGYNKYFAFSITVDDKLFYCMDITPASGQAHATVFFEINKEALANFVFDSIEGNKNYGISVYDSEGTLLFANEKVKYGANSFPLSQIKASDDPYIVTASKYIIYLFSSDLNWQYVFEAHRGVGTLNLTSSAIYLSAIIFFVLAMTVVASLLFSRLFLAPLAKENATMREIINRTSLDSLTIMFSRLVSGQPIDEDYIRITLDVTNCGFDFNGMYAAGFIEYTGNKERSIDERHRILHMINIVLEKFTQKNNCHTHAHFADNSSYYIVISFPQETSAAKGKKLITELTEALTDYPEAFQYPLFITFGHIYKSVHDVVYSYNEAIRMRRVVYINTNAEPDAKTKVEPPTEQTYFPDEEFSSILERRASQIAETLFNEKEEAVQSLITRTIDDISSLNEDEFDYNIKFFITALAENMLSYPFVNLTTIHSVTEHLESELNAQPTSEVVLELLEESIYALCDEFKECIKKQRSPYILAAQNYIASHYSDSDISLEEIAAELKIATNYLSSLFSKNLGKKLFEYITEYRLGCAIDLLHNTNLSINDISEKCGFGSSRNFIRIFKKYKDTTPGAYRKTHLQNKQGE